MKPIAKKDCMVNDIYYAKGEEIKANNIEQLKRLNEIGFIEPLTMKEMQDYFKKTLIRFNKEEE